MENDDDDDDDNCLHVVAYFVALAVRCTRVDSTIRIESIELALHLPTHYHYILQLA